MNNSRIGVVSIATNKNLEFYFDLLNSFKENSLEFSSVIFYVFTDRGKEARQYASDKDFTNVVTIEIPSLGWPDASLLRYRIFDESKYVFETDILVYLDADMLVVKNPISYFALANQAMTFVRHPGYYFEFSRRYAMYSIMNPRKILSIFLSLVKNGGFGSWDTKKFSAAYVPRQERKHYYCGGVWFARKNAFLDFCKQLSERTASGLQQNYVPIWHDESYLNWFASREKHNELNPLFCSDGIIDSLFTEKPYLLAVDKPILGFHGN